MKQLKIYITFDLEEFDIVNEWGGTVPWQQQIATTVEGMKRVEEVLTEKNITATFFTTAAFALEQPVMIKRLAARHEIASHTYWHSAFVNKDLQASRKVLHEISQQEITGLRMPRMRQVDPKIISAAGYTYDSSINPTRLPGRYNFSHLPRTSFLHDGLLRIPASVSPRVRLPLFWLGFKNYPFWLFKKLALRTLKHDGYLNLYFHPWEFAALQHFSLPWFIRQPSGQKLADRLVRLIDVLQQQATFHQLKHFTHEKAPVLYRGLNTITSS